MNKKNIQDWHVDKINEILKTCSRLNLHKDDKTKDLFIQISCYFQDYIEYLESEYTFVNKC